MLAIMPQNSGACSVITFGLGGMPWIVMAPAMTAMIAFDGTPSVRSGTNDVCAPALLAASGAATPSTAPWPNSSGRLDIFFSMA